MVSLVIHTCYDVASIFWSEDKENVTHYVYTYCVKRFGISEIFVLNSQKKNHINVLINIKCCSHLVFFRTQTAKLLYCFTTICKV